jgi:hypothetical protein
MKDLLSKFSEPKKPVKSENIVRAQARKIAEEGWIFLEDKPALIGKMVRAARGKTMVTLKINESKMEYSTIVVDVDRQSGTYKLDQLMDEKAHSQIEPGAILKMYGYIDGVKSHWDGSVLRIEPGDEMVSKSGQVLKSVVYVVHCPFEMYFIQRRNSFRLSPGMHRTIKMQFESFGEMIDVEVRDISVEGVGLWLFRDPDNYGIAAKHTVPGVLIWESFRAEVDFTCLWVNETKEGLGWRVGGLYTCKDDHKLRDIERLIRGGELELLREERG